MAVAPPMPVSTTLIHRLASLYGVQLDYIGADGRRHRAPEDVLLAVLAALGAPVARMADVPEALRARRAALAGRGLDPVVVAWDGRRAGPVLSLPAAAGPAACRLVLQDGERRTWTAEPARRRVVRTEAV